MDRGIASKYVMDRPFIIGTRASPLALWQARWVQSLLAGEGSADKETRFPIRKFTTSGDKLKGELKDFGGKGLFTKELEQALLDGEIDMAVHSMKDVRLEKLEAGVCDATFLACAGLKRLGQGHIITEEIESNIMLNAPAQGAVGVETRADNHAVIAVLAALNHEASSMTVRAERGFLQGLDGSCRTPIAALAYIDGDGLHLKGEVLSLTGDKRFTARQSAAAYSAETARDLGLELAEQIRRDIGDLDSLFAGV